MDGAGTAVALSAPNTPTAAKQERLLKPKTNEDVAHLLERAAKGFRAGNLARAESDAQAVLKAVPDHPEALYCLGLVRYRQGRATQGIDLLRKALSRHPGFAPCSVTLSKMLLDTGDGAGAVRVLSDAAAQSPGDANLLFELGRTRIMLNDPSGGAEDLGRALELAPEAAPIYGSLGGVAASVSAAAASIPSSMKRSSIHRRVPPHMLLGADGHSLAMWACP